MEDLVFRQITITREQAEITACLQFILIKIMPAMLSISDNDLKQVSRNEEGIKRGIILSFILEIRQSRGFGGHMAWEQNI
jgi:hypothetical protein